MGLNWIDVNDFSFHSFLLLERFQIRVMCDERRDNAEWRQSMGAALRGHPEVLWYLRHRCPERGGFLRELAETAPEAADAGRLRDAELAALGAVEDFILYTRPELMDTSCDFIYGWDPARLFELADFDGKLVLDVGSGSGRLAFAVAGRAREIYAVEPVGTLREYLRERAARENIRNLRVTDGLVDALPYPDDTFDIVMSGHVVGDDYDAETAELARVVKSGGWLLDCPGEDSRKYPSDGELVRRGWEELHYVSSSGGDVYRRRKQIWK